MGSAGVSLKVRRHKEKIAIITMNTPVFVVCVCVCTPWLRKHGVNVQKAA